MRSRILPAIGIGAVAVAIAVSYGLPASAHGTHISPAHAATTHTATATKIAPGADSEKACRGANLQANDNGVAIVSQNFETSFDIYDSQGADDFTLTGRGCKVSDVYVDGLYFNGAGPADSVNVTIYKDNGGTPGRVKVRCNDQAYTDSTGTGSFRIDIEDTACVSPDVKLGAGTYWVSVQANMNFSTGGEWGWGTNNTVSGNASQWRNPADGFGTGCTTYTTTTTCIAASEGGDFSFSVRK